MDAYYKILFKSPLIIGICLLLYSCHSKELNTEVYSGNFVHDNSTREYLFYNPTTTKGDTPLVVVLHGFTSSAKKIMEYSKMNALAKKHNFAVLYPQGTKDKEDNTFWNVGYSFHENVAVDDVDYLEKLTKFIQKQHQLSATNTFLTGMSNGGEMCYLMICKYPDLFRASAPIAGMMLTRFFEDCNNSNPSPILAVFGTHDDITNYDGDLENRDGWGAYQSIPYTIDYWGKSINYTSIIKDTLPDLNKFDDSYVVRNQFLNENNGKEVLFYKVINGGHDWPGSSGNMDIDTSKEIWRFFNKHLFKSSNE